MSPAGFPTTPALPPAAYLDQVGSEGGTHLIPIISRGHGRDTWKTRRAAALEDEDFAP